MKKTTTINEKIPKRLELGVRLEKVLDAKKITYKDIREKGKVRGFSFNVSSISQIKTGKRPLNNEILEVLILDYKVNIKYLLGASMDLFVNDKKVLPEPVASLSDIEHRLSVLENRDELIEKDALFIRQFYDYLKQKRFSEIQTEAVALHLENLQPKKFQETAKTEELFEKISSKK